ncbi:MAG: Zn-ribbon containing protein [Candidatus Nanoarchaeia archaeon]|jgi:predicted  nucleic acid-binding Zn-ribbon protein
MPHQCVRCGKRIEDGSKQLLTGCEACGGRFFFYIKDKELSASAELIRNSLSETDVKEMERDVRDLLGDKSPGKPVILDLETIKTLGPGKFEIDISALMRGEPIVINISEGKYYIDLSSAFKDKGKSNMLRQLK